jgi:pimeloyl-ACP methyl ester carboxylesterase
MNISIAQAPTSQATPSGSVGVARRVSLPDAVDGQRCVMRASDIGRVSYYRGGTDTGRPVVFVHSVNAAPSAYEMKPLFEHYRATRPVFAPDLPGFGFSDRPDRPYSPELYADAIGEFLRQVVGQPADLVGLSLGAEFVARVATVAPDLATTLVLISPTGFSSRTIPGGEKGMRLHRVASVPGLSQGVWGALTSRPSIRYFLGRSHVGPVPAEMIDYAYATSHQPGARYAPLYFLAGQLFTQDAPSTLYSRVTQPVLAIYDRDPYIDFDLLPGFLPGRVNWTAQRIGPALGLPHWEHLPETVAALDRFWAGQR